jgi:hypothetical protein
VKPITRDCRHPQKKKNQPISRILFCINLSYEILAINVQCQLKWKKLHQPITLGSMRWFEWPHVHNAKSECPKWIHHSSHCMWWLVIWKTIFLKKIDLLQGYSRTRLQIFNLHFIGNNGWQSYTSGCCMLQAFHSKRWTMLTTILKGKQKVYFYFLIMYFVSWSLHTSILPNESYM